MSKHKDSRRLRGQVIFCEICGKSKWETIIKGKKYQCRICGAIKENERTNWRKNLKKKKEKYQNR